MVFAVRITFKGDGSVELYPIYKGSGKGTLRAVAEKVVAKTAADLPSVLAGLLESARESGK